MDKFKHFEDRTVNDEVKFYEPSFKALHPHLTRSTGWFNVYEKAFETCLVGQSFMIGHDKVKTGTLRSAVHKYSKAKGKDFTVIKHELCYEIYRKE